MTNQEFVDAVRAKLETSSLPRAFIDQQCEKLIIKINELTPENAQKYANEANVDVFADKIVKRYNTKNASDSLQSNSDDKTRVDIPSQENSQSTHEAEKEQSSAEADNKNDESNEKIQIITEKSSSDTVVVFEKTGDVKKKNSFTLSFGDGIDSVNPHPNLLFAALLILIAPVGILLLGAAGAGFLAVFMALAAVIIVTVAAIVIVVGVGSVVSVASLLYGATQILSAPRYVGIHEIGLGLLVAGITILVSVILYNIAIRLVPFIYAKLISFIKFTIKLARKLITKARKGCENL